MRGRPHTNRTARAAKATSPYIGHVRSFGGSGKVRSGDRRNMFVRSPRKQPPDGYFFFAWPHTLQLRQSQNATWNTPIRDNVLKSVLQVCGEFRWEISKATTPKCTCPGSLEEMGVRCVQQLYDEAVCALLTFGLQNQAFVRVRYISLQRREYKYIQWLQRGRHGRHQKHEDYAVASRYVCHTGMRVTRGTIQQ